MLVNVEFERLNEPSRFFGFFHSVYTAWIILGLSLALTVLAYVLTHAAVQQRWKDHFDFKAQELEQAILDRTALYEQVLWGGVGLFNANDAQVDRKRFALYVDALNLNEHWPGVQGVGFSVPVAPNELAAHVAAIRQEGFPDYQLRPSGVRDVYTATIYLEPFDWRNQRAFGFDMWSDAWRREAMRRARDEGRAAMSGMITLVQETDENVQRGFLMYVPVYRHAVIPDTVAARRQAFVGWVYAPFRAGNLMQGILAKGDPHIEFEIFDGERITADNVLFDSNDVLHLSEAAHQPLFSRAVRVRLQGRTWTLYFNTPTRFVENNHEANLPAYVAIAGLTVDVLLFYVIYSLYLNHRRVQRVSRDWRAVIEQAPNAIIITDHAGRIVNTNSQAAILFEYTAKELLGKSIEILVPEANQHQHVALREGFQAAPKARAMGKGRDLSGLKKDGSLVPVEIGLSPLNMARGRFVVASIVDTSEYKRIRQSLENSNAQMSQKNLEMEQFIYTVSHDLKSPLVTIGGFSHQLFSGFQEQLNEKQQHQFKRIFSNVAYMENLLDDLLMLSRVIRQNVAKGELVVREVVDKVLRILESTVTQPDVTVTVQVLPQQRLYGNARLVSQCLQNLIVNAIQYRSPDRDPVIRIDAQVLPHATRLSVQDNGMGIV
ncbi:MAG: CHASE domain-containing protein [Gammaproteobacteria bacterium]